MLYNLINEKVINIKVVLPIRIPEIISYGHHTLPLSIVADISQFQEWFYSNFIQLVAISEESLKLDFFTDLHITDKVFLDNYPYLTTNKLNRSLMKKLGISLIDFFETCLCEGMYIYLFFDEYRIPGKLYYDKEHYFSDALIHGFDRDEQSFHVLGYDRKMQFVSMPVKYDSLMKGYEWFEKLYVVQNPQDDRRSSLYLLQSNQTERSPFDLIHVKERLRDYLSCTNTSESYRMFHTPMCSETYHFGMNIYIDMDNYLEQIVTDGIPLKVDAYHTLLTHKTVMLKRMEYIQQLTGNVFSGIKSFNEIVRSAYHLQNILIKYSFSGQPSMLARARELLRVIQDSECDCLNDFLDYLN